MADSSDHLDSLIALLDELHDPANPSCAEFTINTRSGRTATVWESGNDGNWKWTWTP